MLNQGLFFADTPNRGRGMFTSTPIPADTVIENAPVIVMSAEERTLLDRTKLHDYIFEWNAGDTNGCCMAQGFISVYNHSYTSNCEYFMNYDEKTIQIITVREIKAGEELTINYNGDWDDEKPVWFEAN
jgi:SET domain-containing protein